MHLVNHYSFLFTFFLIIILVTFILIAVCFFLFRKQFSRSKLYHWVLFIIKIFFIIIVTLAPYWILEILRRFEFASSLNSSHEILVTQPLVLVVDAFLFSINLFISFFFIFIFVIFVFLLIIFVLFKQTHHPKLLYWMLCLNQLIILFLISVTSIYNITEISNWVGYLAIFTFILHFIYYYLSFTSVRWNMYAVKFQRLLFGRRTPLKKLTWFTVGYEFSVPMLFPYTLNLGLLTVFGNTVMPVSSDSDPVIKDYVITGYEDESWEWINALNLDFTLFAYGNSLDPLDSITQDPHFTDPLYKDYLVIEKLSNNKASNPVNPDTPRPPPNGRKAFYLHYYKLDTFGYFINPKLYVFNYWNYSWWEIYSEISISNAANLPRHTNLDCLKYEPNLYRNPDWINKPKEALPYPFSNYYYGSGTWKVCRSPHDLRHYYALIDEANALALKLIEEEKTEDFEDNLTIIGVGCGVLTTYGALLLIGYLTSTPTPLQLGNDAINFLCAWHSASALTDLIWGWSINDFPLEVVQYDELKKEDIDK